MLVFAWFFIVFMHQRARHAEAFNAAHKSLNLTFGVLNTMLLLTGSWFVVMAVHALRVNNQRLGKGLIKIAIACGLGFVVNKVLEYHDRIAAGHPHEQADFFMYYFVLTGIHLVHLLIGLAVLTLMLRVAGKPVLGPRQFRTLESGASFWHLVDLLWLVLFALFYLVSG
ncbi:cytochrome c oxidase subunit 3 [Mycobacterium florentinum]|nr:cytochrome c oxidase subunit 3 [Mycobacterium florentinum]